MIITSDPKAELDRLVERKERLSAVMKTTFESYREQEASMSEVKEISDYVYRMKSGLWAHKKESKVA